jgi:CheY-like chemotaxis protein
MSRKPKFEVVSLNDVPQDDTVALPGKPQPVLLIVDDERLIADTLSLILSRSGFSTLTAYDGHSALELAREFSPELVITDVVMPKMTGVELAIALNNILPVCKVMLFSGQAATVDLLEKARGEGHSFETYAKPVHPTEMIRIVSERLASPPSDFTPTWTTQSNAFDSLQEATRLPN